MDNNNLINSYKLLLSNPENFDSLTSSRKSNVNFNFYSFYNTNIRRVGTLEKYIRTFSNLIGKERVTWPVYEKNGEEQDKQKVSFLEKYEIIIKDSKSNRYFWTEKGQILFDLINSEKWKKWEENEKFSLFVLNILKENEVQRTFNIIKLLTNYFSFEIIDFKILERLSHPKRNILNLINNDLFIFHSFLNFPDFLFLYFNSSEKEKNEFRSFLVLNFKAKNIKDALYKKYKSGGNFTSPTFHEEWQVFYIISNLLRCKKDDFMNASIIFNNFFDIIKKLPLSSNNFISLLNFIKKNSELYLKLFKNAFIKIMENNKNKIFKEKNLENFSLKEFRVSLEDKPEEKIDISYEYGRKKIQARFLYMKPFIREQASYKCSLEKIRNCSYFTSKKTNKNYLEIHHLIPKSHSDSFTSSIEVSANYVALCANCHRLVHQAIKVEREKVLKTLFEERKERLKKCNLIIEEVNTLFNMYE